MTGLYAHDIAYRCLTDDARAAAQDSISEAIVCLLQARSMLGLEGQHFTPDDADDLADTIDTALDRIAHAIAQGTPEDST